LVKKRCSYQHIFVRCLSANDIFLNQIFNIMMNKNFFAMLAFIAGILLLVSAIYSLSSGISTQGLIYFGIAAAALITSYWLRINRQH